MTNQEALEILTRHNAWRRDNETEFPELPDSPALIGEAIDVAIKALGDLEEAKGILKPLRFVLRLDGRLKSLEIITAFLEKTK